MNKNKEVRFGPKTRGTSPKTQDLDRTILNCFKIIKKQQDCSFNLKSSNNYKYRENSSSEDCSSSYYEEDESDEDSVCNEELQESLAALDKNCQKIVQGKDLLQFCHSLANWFTNLRDAFSFATSTPCSATSNRSRVVGVSFKESPIRKSNRCSSCPSTTRTPRCKIIYDSICQVSGDLSIDKELKLKYEPNDVLKPWDDSDICGNFKYKNLMERKCNFYDKLTIIPGIGKVYATRLESKIGNVGTLIEMYLSVDECTFKALLKAYANVNHYRLNLIYTSCKNYVSKFGFNFRDVLIRSPKNFSCTPIKLSSSNSNRLFI